MANSLVPQLYVGVGFRVFCEHGGFHLVRVEDEHPALSSSTRDDSAFFFDEAPFLVESDLHALLNHLANRDQILRDSGYMQGSKRVDSVGEELNAKRPLFERTIARGLGAWVEILQM